MNASTKKLPGKKVTISRLIYNGFKLAIQDQKYWFQYKYRHNSISYIFLKDFISAIAMVILFQYINFKYLVLFAAATFEGLEGEELIAAI